MHTKKTRTEDEYERYICDHRSHCPYYRDGDEYRIAGKQ